ncbi:MAG: mannonate dehydratase [Alistipes sp.]|nr:mannonate dehydratase [Candidatus Minthomonas equi]
MMKFAHLFFSDKPDLKWELCRQMGIKYAIAKLAPDLTGREPIWNIDSFAAAKKTFSSHGLELIGLEGDQFDMTRIKLGLPGREEDAEHYRQMLRNMAELGVTTLCYNFMQTGWFRTSTDIRERGGAVVTGFDMKDAAKLPTKDYAPVDAATIWKNYEWFINEVIPTAEEVGVNMGLHPDDPPVRTLQGIDRIFTDTDAIRRALSLSDSPAHGLTFCQGTYITMGADIPKVVPLWKDRIRFVHIRDVAGNAEHFHETFHDNGPNDIPSLVKLYAENTPDIIIRSDHVPTMAGEDNSRPSYAMNGNLFGIGYIKGILDTLKVEYE